MANHKSAKKEYRQSAKEMLQIYFLKTTRNAMRKLRLLQMKEAIALLPTLESMLDKLTKEILFIKIKLLI